MAGRSAVLSVVAVVGCGAVLKPPAPDRRLNIVQTGSVFEASNGYQFAVLPEARSNVVRMDIRYPVGAADDPAGKAGLAHLVEHLLFDVEYAKGGEKTSVSAELGRVALSWNAETHEDYTSYQTLFSSEYLEEVVGLEVNRIAVGCAGLTPEIFSREREVVLNELRQRQGATGGQLQRVILDELYPAGHPYRAVDTVESVAKLELKDACDFIATQYQRGKAIVIVSGDVTEQDVQKAASKQFIRLRKRKLDAKAPPPRVNPTPGVVKLRADIDEPALFLAAWSLPAQGTRDYRLLQTAWPSIAGIVERQAYLFKWGHSAFAEVLGGAHAPVLVVGIYLNSPGSADDAKSAVSGAIRDAFDWLGHDKDDERWRSRMYLRAESLLASYESLDSRNRLFGDFLMFDSEQKLIIGRVAELQQSSPGDVRSLGEQWLGAHHARYLVIEPSGTMPTQRTLTYAGGAEAHATRVDGALADTPLPAPSPRLGVRAEEYELKNGLTVLLWPYGTAPVVRGYLVIDSGYAHEPAGREGVASLIGADSVQPDSLIFAGRELSIVVDNMIVELGIELRVPGAPLDDDEKEFIQARLQNKRGLEIRAYENKLSAAIYGEHHPYARPGMSGGSIAKIHHDLVQDWARKHVVPKNATLVIAGDFDAELVKKHIAYNVDQVGGGADSNDISFAPPSALRQYVGSVAKSPSPTVQLDIAFLSAPGVDDEYAMRLVLEQVLDAELSRLRTRDALTYGFSASYEPRKGGGLWRIGGDADAARAAAAAEQVLSIIDGLRADPESYRASFVLARQKVVEAQLLATGNAASIAQQLVFAARHDVSPSFFDQIPTKVAKLTLSEFHKFLKRELNASRQVFGAFGNSDAVDAALGAAKAQANPKR
jgi:zinc protease